MGTVNSELLSAKSSNVNSTQSMNGIPKPFADSKSNPPSINSSTDLKHCGVGKISTVV